MKILVTGGAGFLGSHVADALTNAGHEVTIFDTRPSPYLRPEQREIVGSILDAEALDEAVRQADAVYHFAAIADIDEAMNNPLRTIEVNIMGTARIVEAARIHGIKRFVFASSIYVYSHQGSFYRTSKQACERLIEDYHEAYGLPFTILRFGSLYGFRAGMSNTVFRMVNQALVERRIDYAGSGSEIREYIHVMDGAAAAVEVLSPEFENEIIHLTGHERMTTRQMMEMISEILGGGIEIGVNSGSMTGHYVQTPYNYTPKLGRKLICHSYIDLGLGLLDMLQHIDQIPTETTSS